VPLRTLVQKIEYDAVAAAIADGEASFMLLTRIFMHYALCTTNL